MKRGYKEQGTTLVELLIALALFSAVATALIGVYWAGNKAFNRQSSDSDAQYMARTAMQWITKDVSEATTVDIEPDGDLKLNDSLVNEILYHKDDDNQLLRNSTPVAENISSISYNTSSGLLEITIISTSGNKTYTLNSGVKPRIASVSGGICEVDTTPPVITLNGESTVILEVGDTWTDPVTATDNVDGDITSKIVFGGSFENTATEGTYYRTYNVSDNAGNPAEEKTRIIKVEQPGPAPGDPGYDNGYSGDDPFILTSTAGGYLYTSPDGGETWTTQDLDELLFDDWIEMKDIVWDGDKYVIVGKGVVFGRVADSEQGTEWKDELIALGASELRSIT